MTFERGKVKGSRQAAGSVKQVKDDDDTNDGINATSSGNLVLTQSRQYYDKFTNRQI